MQRECLADEWLKLRTNGSGFVPGLTEMHRLKYKAARLATV